jgi:hypothetical protein
MHLDFINFVSYRLHMMNCLLAKLPLPTFSASFSFQFHAEDIVQLRVNMKQLLIRLSSLYSSRKRNELVGSSKLTTRPDTLPLDETKKPSAETKTLTEQQDTHPADGTQTTAAEPKTPTTRPAIDQPATPHNFKLFAKTNGGSNSTGQFTLPACS